VRCKELVKLLEKQGWEIKRIKGSHYYMGRDTQTLTVPVHNNDLAKGMLNALLKQAGLKQETWHEKNISRYIP
jgi:predicted RNA binding protein YcfA (HicA-like mRNA interferase family)